MNEIEKEIDMLGRVVIPIKFRKKLGINNNSKVLISMDSDTILIAPANKSCALCGKAVKEHRELRLCDKCISLAKSIK